MTINEAKCFVDCHCHILPGLDDGPAMIGESIEIAEALVAAGFTTVCCTPHCIRGVYDTTPEQVQAAAAELQEVLDGRGIPLTLIPSFEYYLDEFFLDFLSRALPIPGNLILVEAAPGGGDATFVAETLYQVVRKGFIPLIAHPERCELFVSEVSGQPGAVQRLVDSLGSVLNLKSGSRKPEFQEGGLLATLQSMGCKFQGNYGSFAGFYGEKVRRCAGYFRSAGLYTHYGSDLHSIRHKSLLKVRGDISSARANPERYLDGHI